LLTERDPREFGQAIKRLIEDQALWADMSTRGRQRALECWTWGKASLQLEKNMQKTLQRHAERHLQ
jgi:Glycosyltransferase